MIEDDLSSQRIVAEIKKKDVEAKLRKIAWWSTRSEVAADDLIQDALSRVLEPGRAPWVPGERSFLMHMARVMRYIWSHDRRKAAAQREVLDGGLARTDETPGNDPRADDELDDRRSTAVRRQLGEQVLAALAGDEVARGVLEYGLKGIDEPAKLASLLGCSVDDVYNALDRIKYRARRVLDDWNAAEQARMKRLREGSREKREVAP